MAFKYRNKRGDGDTFRWDAFCKCCPGTVLFEVTLAIASPSIGDAIARLGRTLGTCDQCNQSYLGSALFDMSQVWMDAMIRARPEDEKAKPKKRRIGHNGGSAPGETKRRAVALAKAGRTVVEIARELHIARSTVFHHLHGVPLVDHRKSSNRERALALDKQGMSCKEIATELGLHPSTISNYFSRPTKNETRRLGKRLQA